MQRDAWYFVLPFLAFLLSTLFYLFFMNSFHHFGAEGNRLEATISLYPQLPEGSILFLGESQVREDIDCHRVDSALNISSCYNLGLAGVLPLQLALEKDLIIQAKPSVVFIGVSSVFFDETTNKNDDLFMLLGESRQIGSDSYLLGLLADDEKKLLTMNWYERAIYKRKFILPFYFSIFNAKLQAPSENTNLSAVYDFKNPHFFTLAQNAQELEHRINDPIIKPIFEIENSSLRERQAFVYLLKELHQAGIKVVIVKMPVHPLVLKTIPLTSQAAFNGFISKTAGALGFEVLDYQGKYGANSFNDLTHLTVIGEENFTLDLIRGGSYFIQ